ncbi:MAG: ATP-binding protein [Pseudomonadota bacterium]|nr:ATP-binding protein [Pseudomonadota bacterium]
MYRLDGRVLLPTRIGLLSLFLVVPLLLLLIQLIYGGEERIAAIDRKLNGVNDIRVLQGMVDLAERLRDLSVIVVYDRSEELESEYERQRLELLNSVMLLEKDVVFSQDNPIMELTYPRIIKQIRRVRPVLGAELYTPDVAFREHQPLVETLQQIQFRLADQGGLFSDRNDASLNLTYLALDEFSDLTTDLGRARSYGSLYLRIGHVPSDGVDSLERIYERLVLQHDRLNIRVNQLLKNHAELAEKPPFNSVPWNLLQDAAQTLDDKVIQSADLDTPWRQFYQNVSAYVVTASIYRDQILSRLQEQYQLERREATAQQKWTLGGMGLLVLVYAFIYVMDLREASARQKERQEKEAAEAADRAKSQFLATMSHEIRTPINGVLGMVELLSDTPLNEEQKNYLMALRSSGQTLLAVINDVLDYSKIEAGKLQIDNTVFDLRQSVNEALTLFKPLFRQKGLELNISFEKSVPTLVNCDPQRLRQILMNLVGNGLKFTEQGSVNVRLSVKNTGEKCFLYGVVRDTGIGMDSHQQTELFKQFSQANRSISRRYGGTGLGLAICQRLCRLMGGEIGVSSKQGSGTSFWFTVELQSIDEARLSGFEAAEPSARDEHFRSELKGRRILVAEDNKVNQMVIQGMLKKAGVSVDVVENGLQAYQKVVEEGQRYDCILMDWEMPEWDGITAARRILSWERRKGRPESLIVALTAHVLSDYEAQATEVGMKGFLKKPIEREALFANLIVLLKEQQAQ